MRKSKKYRGSTIDTSYMSTREIDLNLRSLSDLMRDHTIMDDGFFVCDYHYHIERQCIKVFLIHEQRRRDSMERSSPRNPTPGRQSNMVNPTPTW